VSLPIWPVSPLPAGMDRSPFWKLDENFYDSGAYQAMTTYLRPLYQYTIPFQNFTETKQATLIAFWNQQRRAGNQPFYMKDPYDYQVSSVIVANSGVLSAATLQIFDANSFFIRVDTATIGTFLSALSGSVTLGTQYQYNVDSGILTVTSKAINDVWTGVSMQYWRKLVFSNQYRETAVMWNLFSATVEMKEIY
jgi:hypothetical protein